MKKFLFFITTFLCIVAFSGMSYSSDLDIPFHKKKFEVVRDVNKDFFLRTSFYAFDKSLKNYAIFVIREQEKWEEPTFFEVTRQKTKDYLIDIFKQVYKPILDKVVDKSIGLIISFWPATNETIIYFDEEYEQNEKFHEEMKNRINNEMK